MKAIQYKKQRLQKVVKKCQVRWLEKQSVLFNADILQPETIWNENLIHAQHYKILLKTIDAVFSIFFKAIWCCLGFLQSIMIISSDAVNSTIVGPSSLHSLDEKALMKYWTKPDLRYEFAYIFYDGKLFMEYGSQAPKTLLVWRFMSKQI